MMRTATGFSMVGFLILGVVVTLIGIIVVAVNSGYDTRRWVSEAIVDSEALKSNVMAFRVAQGRWPGQADAARFVVDPSKLKRARSVAYDPGQRAIVITMDEHAYAGRSFAFYGAEGAKGPEWSCRAIDIETKYLPAACR